MVVWHHQTAYIVTSLLCMRSIPNLTFKPGFRFNDLHFAMQGHILDQAVVMSTYDV